MWLLLLCGALVLILGFVVQRDLWLLGAALVGVVALVASTYGFLAHRGPARLLALALLMATPLALAWLFVYNGLLWPLLGRWSPRTRPGVPRPRPHWDLAALVRLGLLSRSGARD